MNKKYIIGVLVLFVLVMLLVTGKNPEDKSSVNGNLNLNNENQPVNLEDNKIQDKKPEEPSSQENVVIKNTNVSTTSTNLKIPVGIVKNDTGDLRQTLLSGEWYWIKTERGLRPISPDTEIVTPKTQTDFLLTFSSSGNLSIDTDCNSMSGTYKLDGIKLTFSQLVSTQMYCEGSVESEFAESLKTGTTYYLSFDGAGKMYIVSNETMYFVKK